MIDPRVPSSSDPTTEFESVTTTDTSVIDDKAFADDELLVAYLDGELPRDERGLIEQRLINDEAFRSRLQSLQRGWEMLDLLPTPVTTEKNVQSTLELVVADVNRASRGSLTGLTRSSKSVAGGNEDASTPKHFSLHRWSWALLPLIAMLASFAAIRSYRVRGAARQAADFPVAIDMDAYALAQNESLIDDLMASPRWRAVVADSMIPDVERLIASDMAESAPSPEVVSSEADSFDQPSSVGTLLTQEPLTLALSQIPDDQRLVALSRWERFDRLNDQSKDELRDTATALRQHEDATTRLETIRDYARWREQLSRQMVQTIEGRSGYQRELAIESAIAETVTAIGRATGRNLSEEAIERIDFTLIQIVKDRLRGVDLNDRKLAEKLIGERMGRFHSQRGKIASDPNAIHRMIARTIVFRDPNRDASPLDSRELEMIESMLPAKDADTLERYVSDPWMRSMILQDWAQEAVRRKSRGETKPPTLPEFYDSLSDSEREVVDLMPPDKARRWLSEMAR